eukprot:14649295-Alexandrium_andersonii.AAC.1
MRPCRIEIGANPEVCSGTAQFKLHMPESISHFTVTLVTGQSELGAQHPARWGRCPSTPDDPNGPLSGSESAKVGNPPAALPGTGGAARSMAPPALGLGMRSLTFAASKLRRGPFGPLGVLGPRPPRAGCSAPSSL